MTDPLDRRSFLKTAGATAGLAAVGASSLGAATPPEPASPSADRWIAAPAINGKTYDVAVIGAGAFGGWTAYWARKLGASVALIDAYGPGNSRSTSGDETRGVRTSYGDRPHGEQWMQWASRSIQRWKAWDDEWGRDLKMRLFVTTGDFIFRNEWENFTKTTRDLFVKNGISTLSVDVEIVKKDSRNSTCEASRPVSTRMMPVSSGAPSTQCVAEVLQKIGGDVVVARAYPGPLEAGRMGSLILNNREVVKAQYYVFALGPWLGKTFPGCLAPECATRSAACAISRRRTATTVSSGRTCRASISLE